jgi:hypothetical protein
VLATLGQQSAAAAATNAASMEMLAAAMLGANTDGAPVAPGARRARPLAETDVTFDVECWSALLFDGGGNRCPNMHHTWKGLLSDALELSQTLLNDQWIAYAFDILLAAVKEEADRGRGAFDSPKAQALMKSRLWDLRTRVSLLKQFPVLKNDGPRDKENYGKRSSLHAAAMKEFAVEHDETKDAHGAAIARLVARAPRDTNAAAKVKGHGKGKCHICHESGHYAADCSKKSEVTCYACGTKGHKAPTCTATAAVKAEYARGRANQGNGKGSGL